MTEENAIKQVIDGRVMTSPVSFLVILTSLYVRIKAKDYPSLQNVHAPIFSEEN